MTIKMANTSSEGFVSSASRRAAASGRALRAYQTKDVDQLYRELLHKRYQPGIHGPEPTSPGPSDLDRKILRNPGPTGTRANKNLEISDWTRT